MALRRATYSPPIKGRATAFVEAELPIVYANDIKNRFVNKSGGLERRQGVTKVSASSGDLGASKATSMHELVDASGEIGLYVGTSSNTLHQIVSGSGDNYDFLVVSADYHTSGTNARQPSFEITDRLRSVQMADKLIFTDGSALPFFIDNASVSAAPQLLRSIIRIGTVGSGIGTTSLSGLTDADVSDWTATDVAVNDLVHFPEHNSYGIITSIGAGDLNFTNVGSAAADGDTGGMGICQSGGDGQTWLASAPGGGSSYEIIDMVALNIVPTGLASLDNVDTLASGSDTNEAKVSGYDLLNTSMHKWDVVRNTTRTQGAFVVNITTTVAGLQQNINSQVAGDSVVFLKEAMPRTSFHHVHYGRLYVVDARNKSNIQISAPFDPQDFTSEAAGSIFSIGDLQPTAENVLSLGTYQNFFVILGDHNVFVYSGVDPVGQTIDASASDSDFTPIALFTQGAVAPLASKSIGSDFVFLSNDGLQAISQLQDQTALGNELLTRQIADEIREQIKDTDPNEIEIIHYDRRSWLLIRVGSNLHLYNYETVQTNRDETFRGSISRFTSVFSSCRTFLERANGDLWCAGASAGFDLYLDRGDYSDAGQTFDATLETGLLTLSEPDEDVRRKNGKYIKPAFEVSAPVVYTISATAGYNLTDTSETITVTASGSPERELVNTKHALRWHCEAARFTIKSSGSAPDTISQYTVYASEHGSR